MKCHHKKVLTHFLWMKKLHSSKTTQITKEHRDNKTIKRITVYMTKYKAHIHTRQTVVFYSCYYSEGLGIDFRQVFKRDPSNYTVKLWGKNNVFYLFAVVLQPFLFLHSAACTFILASFCSCHGASTGAEWMAPPPSAVQIVAEKADDLHTLSLPSKTSHFRKCQYLVGDEKFM